MFIAAGPSRAAHRMRKAPTRIRDSSQEPGRLDEEIPWIYERFLEDVERVFAKRETIKAQIRKMKEKIAEYEAKWNAEAW